MKFKELLTYLNIVSEKRSMVVRQQSYIYYN